MMDHFNRILPSLVLASRHKSVQRIALAMVTSDSAVHWDAAALLGASEVGAARYAAIILNQPISASHKVLVERIWRMATLRLCADGGANRLYDCYGEEGVKPHEIRGDLDSLRPDVRAFYEQQGVSVVTAASQYATDLQKCVLRVEQAEDAAQDDGEMAVVIIGGLSGRLDQTMHTMHVLCQLSYEIATDSDRQGISKDRTTSQGLKEDDFVTLQRRSKTIVLSENSVAWVLSKGKHRIAIDHKLFGQTCGLLPFAAQMGEQVPSTAPRIETQGLEWDLNGEQCAVGGFLSTSNHLKADMVTVEVDSPIIWTMEVREDAR